MTPFFSIIMPVYNVEDAFPASLDSVLAQDDRDFELILVDDGSTDRSGQLCDACAAEHDFVRVIHKPNGGLASARNAGIDNARGQYILMPDSDDLIEANTLSTVRDAIRKATLQSEQPVDMVRYDLQRHEADNTSVYTTDVPEGLYAEGRVSELLDLALLDSFRFPLSACTHAYRRDFLNENALRFVSEREVFSEDFLFLISALMVAKSLYVTNKVLYHYISRAGSLTNGPRKDALRRYTALYNHLLEFAARHGADDGLCRKISTYYINMLVYGYCIVLEYRVYPGHSWEDGRRNVKRILKDPTVKSASGRVYLRGLKPKHILRILCIHMGWEAPLAFTQRQWKKAEGG